MHEMSLAHGVVQIPEEAAAREGFRRVTAARRETGGTEMRVRELEVA